MKSALLLLPGAFSGIGGIEMYNRQLIRAFLELGHERGFAVRTLVKNDSTTDVDYRYIPAGATSPRGFSRDGRRFAAAALWNALRSQPDIIVFGHVHFARIAPLLRILTPRSRHWHIVHGIEVWQPLPASTRRGLALADRVLAVSDYSRRELVRNGGMPVEKIDLLPCSLDPVWQAQYEPKPGEARPYEPGRPTLLTVARLDASERYKGIDSVIRALPAILKDVPDVLYDVVGDGDDRPRLEALAREQSVSEHVRFRGRLWPDELAAAYRGCTLYVMPSSKEGFGIVFLEAALFGKPSIAGRHGGSPEVVEDRVSGLLVEREDIEGLAASVLRLLTREDERSRMGASARARLERQSTYGTFRTTIEGQLMASGRSRRDEAIEPGLASVRR